jgi:hypothetical protein
LSGGHTPHKKERHQSGLVWLAVALIILALAASLWINAGRLDQERRDKTVGLLVDYDELKRVADAGQEIVFADMLRKARKAGATGLIVRERILADWEAAGDVVVMQGSELELLYRPLSAAAPAPGVGADSAAPDAGPAANANASGPAAAPAAGPLGGRTVAPTKTYILTKDPAVYRQIFALLETKRRYPETFALDGYQVIAAQLYSGERAALGLGWPLAQLEEAAAMGFEIIPRLRNWEPVRGENLATVFEWVSKIPNLAGVGFNDAAIPGGDTPAILDLMAEQIRPLERPLISFEFYDQAGLPDLAARLGDQVIRAHAIAENELRKYADFDDAAARFLLAAGERNIRYIYLRFYGLENPVAAVDINMDLIERIGTDLAAAGFQFGRPTGFAAFTVSFPLCLILGAGIIAAGGWLLALIAGPLTGRKFALPFALLLAVGFLLWAMLLWRLPILTRKLGAFAAAVVFPSLAAFLVLRTEMRRPRQPAAKPSLIRAICQLVGMSVGTLAGGMILSALLADTAFMLRLDSFAGVKLAHLLPLLLVPAGLWLREKNWRRLLGRTVASGVKVWQLGVGLAVLAALAIYILRTGNDSLGAVSNLEMRFRQLLDQILGVRPRTKEFLVGHPFMLLLLYFGYRFEAYPVLLLGLIGQISLINTYAHIHTPLLVSLSRSGNGLWVGIAVGCLAVAVIRLAAKIPGLLRRAANTKGED